MQLILHKYLTAVLVWLAYWFGRRHGSAAESKAMSRVLDQVARRLGVPPEDDYWSEEAFHRWALELNTAFRRNRKTEEQSKLN